MTKDTENATTDEKKLLDLKFKAAAILRDEKMRGNRSLRAVAASILRE